MEFETPQPKMYSVFPNLFIRKVSIHLNPALSVSRYSHHPGIVSLRGVYEDGKCLLVVTELLRGGELLEHITQRGRLPEAEARAILNHVLQAVHYLHQHGVVHR